MNEIAQIIGIVRDIAIICVLVFILVVFLPLSRRLLSMFTSLDKLIAKSKFKSMPHFAQADSGHIGLQHHGQEVWYRNIKIRKL